VGCQIWWHGKTSTSHYKKCLLLLEWILQTSMEVEHAWWILENTSFIAG
jgi:hypothetical protein